MPVQFTDVEIIELPIVAGANHPSQQVQASKNVLPEIGNGSTPLDDDPTRPLHALHLRSGGDEHEEELAALDSAAITLDWQAQSRTRMTLEEYEEEKARKKKKGKLRRLTRAVRKRILNNSGVETSDIESEDERSSQKRKKKKKKKKMRIPGKKLVMSTIRSSHDRFSSAPVPTRNQAPQAPTRDLSRRKDDAAPRVPTRCLVSPTPARMNLSADDFSDSQRGRSKTLGISKDFLRTHSPAPKFASNHSRDKDDGYGGLDSIGESKKKSQYTFTGAMVSLAKQPAKLAKKPVKLAKSTRKRLTKLTRHTSDAGEFQPTLPSLPPIHYPGETDDEINLREHYDVQTPSHHTHGSGDSQYSSRERTSNDDEYGSALPPNLPVRVESGAAFSEASSKSGRKHFTSAMATLAKHPVKLVKKPVKLAKSTHKMLKRRTSKPAGGVPFSPDSYSASPSAAASLHSRMEAPDDFLKAIDPQDVGSASCHARILPGDPVLSTPRQKKHRRSSLEHVTNAFGVLAKQPAKLARTPVKLAASTTKRIKRSRKKAKLAAAEARRREREVSISSDESSLDDIAPRSNRMQSDPDYRFTNVGFESSTHLDATDLVGLSLGPFLPPIPPTNLDDDYIDLSKEEESSDCRDNSMKSTVSFQFIDTAADTPGRTSKRGSLDMVKKNIGQVWLTKKQSFRRASSIKFAYNDEDAGTPVQPTKHGSLDTVKKTIDTTASPVWQAKMPSFRRANSMNVACSHNDEDETKRGSLGAMKTTKKPRFRRANSMRATWSYNDEDADTPGQPTKRGSLDIVKRYQPIKRPSFPRVSSMMAECSTCSIHQHNGEDVGAPIESTKRGSLDMVKKTIGVIAYQPVWLAKQPAKLVRSTHKRFLGSSPPPKLQTEDIVSPVAKEMLGSASPSALLGESTDLEAAISPTRERASYDSIMEIDWDCKAERDSGSLRLGDSIDSMMDFGESDEEEITESEPNEESPLDMNKTEESPPDEAECKPPSNSSNECCTQKTTQMVSDSSLEDTAVFPSSARMLTMPIGARISFTGEIEEFPRGDDDISIVSQ